MGNARNMFMGEGDFRRKGMRDAPQVGRAPTELRTRGGRHQHRIDQNLRAKPRDHTQRPHWLFLSDRHAYTYARTITINTPKLTYLKNLGNKVNDPSTSQKAYWKLINRVMNKCRSPKIPLLLVNNMFVLNCSEKAKIFNDYFSKQSMSIIISSVTTTKFSY